MGIGSQNWKSRQVRTPSSAAGCAVPNDTSIGTPTPSTIPSPPGVIGRKANSDTRA